MAIARGAFSEFWGENVNSAVVYFLRDSTCDIHIVPSLSVIIVVGVRASQRIVQVEENLASVTVQSLSVQLPTPRGGALRLEFVPEEEKENKFVIMLISKLTSVLVIDKVISLIFMSEGVHRLDQYVFRVCVHFRCLW